MLNFNVTHRATPDAVQPRLSSTTRSSVPADLLASKCLALQFSSFLRVLSCCPDSNLDQRCIGNGNLFTCCPLPPQVIFTMPRPPSNDVHTLEPEVGRRGQQARVIRVDFSQTVFGGAS